ncbi:multidrug resistance-associated protein 4 [Cephus cinctus]|uniref:Multidrug resistance-associated protein 4 n=1 Tax=Cephus cinctus TaxID=211228 RepID=A0AAJ7CHC3_CEPCN|nr:multidrug resistance-associated protein 4 [Cephus cinctus]
MRVHAGGGGVELKMDSSKKFNNPNPINDANPFSRLIFWWLKPLFSYGRNHDLEVKNLYNALPRDHSERLGNKLERNWNEELKNAEEKKRNPKLLNALIKTFIWSYMYYGGWILLLSCVIRVVQPHALSLLISHFTPGSDSTPQRAYTYATIVIVLAIIYTFVSHHCNMGQLLIGMRVRVACSSLIYRKILRLSTSAVGRTAGGQVINLLSNDVARFDNLFMFLHYIWIMPIQAMLIGFFIWQSVGIAALAGLVLITCQTIPVQGYMSKWTSKLRLKIALRTDERVRLMSEIIGGIQVIKMYTWEKPFEKLVSMARIYEVKVLTLNSYLKGFNLATFVFTERTTLFFTLMTYALMGNVISADKAFSIAQYFNILQATMAIFYPLAVSSSAEALVSIKRLQDFLMLDENVPSLTSQPSNEKVGVTVKDVTASWTEKSISNTLHKVNLKIPPGKLCAIVGPVGSGKSSFLQLMLGELQPSQGKVIAGGIVSYASQEAWLFLGTVRNNILFGLPYDKDKYKKVTEVCALVKDFEQFPQGDKTFVGDRGNSLSGGQRARINLARAVYRDADVYLLDDPLSAVDTHVGKHLFDQCINGYLRSKTRILVTHQVQYLKDADVIVILNNGQIENQGTFEELQKSSVNIAKLITSEDQEEKPSEVSLRKRLVSEVSYASAVDDEEDEEEPQETEELMAKGEMSKSVYWKYIRAGASIFAVMLFIMFLVLGQFGSSGSDYWVAYWIRQEELKLMYNTEFLRNLNESSLNSTTIIPSILSRDNIGNNLFNDTLDIISAISPFTENITEESFNSTKSLNNLESVTSLTTEWADELSTIFNDASEGLPLPEKLQSNNSTKKPIEISYMDTSTALWIYGAFVALSFVGTTLRNIFFYRICMNASRNLHDLMFSCILKAPMHFFDSHSSGRILNRFSKDIGAVDEILPSTIIESIQVFAVMTGILLQVVIINWWAIFPISVMGFFYWKIRTIYMATAWNIKRLEGVTKSPVFSHVNSSMSGLATIRASRVQEMVLKDFDGFQDVHTGATYLLIASSTAFGFWLDVVSNVFVAVVTYSFILLDTGDTFAGNVGLAISQVLILCGMLQHGMRQSSEMVSQMTSVERILEFTKLEKEGPFESHPTHKPPATWPSKGQLKFEHLYLRYSDTDAPVLKDLNLIVRPAMKVGVVGRTGAGKSSLISALFHLGKLDGDIYLDEVSVKKIGLHDLRSKISIIPQEPVLFSASLRDNLDPFHKFEDAALWDALEEVELKNSVPSLDHQVNHGGSNFSAGQRQLVCLARAIVRNNKVLVLDEATANVDPTTDALIQTTIRRKFKNCTVLTVAHRLNTIMDSDKVLVMDQGEAVEFGHPHELLQNENGYFSNMVRETGTVMTEQLKRIAKEAFENIHEEVVAVHQSNGNVSIQETLQ